MREDAKIARALDGVQGGETGMAVKSDLKCPSACIFTYMSRVGGAELLRDNKGPPQRVRPMCAGGRKDGSCSCWRGVVAGPLGDDAGDALRWLRPKQTGKQ